MQVTASGLETAILTATSVEAATVGFALADLRANRDSARALSFLDPMAHHLTPRGCIAQAWIVGEILRAWSLISAGSRE